MIGWIIPPAKPSTKTSQEFLQERLEKVRELEAKGFLRSPRLKAAMRKVPREAFIPYNYRDYTYQEFLCPCPARPPSLAPIVTLFFMKPYNSIWGIAS